MHNLISDNFEKLLETPNSIKNLRKLILQLAIQGKLVPQNQQDEPASVLLEKINKEKEKLFKEGKIKKTELLPPIKDEEKPYKLPKGWEWCRFISLVDYRKAYPLKRGPFGSSIRKSMFVPKEENTYKVYEQKNAIYNDPSLGHYYISSKDYELLKGFAVEGGDLIISCSGTVGKIGFLPALIEKGIINQALLKICLNEIIINKEYFGFLFDAFIMKTDKMQDLKGTAIKNIPEITVLKNMPLPLPHLSEQSRIVAKVNQLMALCDELEAKKEKQNKTIIDLNAASLDKLFHSKTSVEFSGNWNRITNNFDLLLNNVENVQKLRQSILQFAVMGKLVPQDPRDEPAGALLDKIKKEKEKLIKEGKIRKSEPLPPIKDAEKPYELPKGWEWTCLSEIGIVNPRNDKPDNEVASFLPMATISAEYGGAIVPEQREWGEIKKGFTHVAENDVVLAKITPCFENGKSAVMKNLTNGFGAGTTELHVFRPVGNTIFPDYVLIYLKSPIFIKEGELKMTGSAGQKRVPKEYFANNPFPLPPLPEQSRIVDMVNQLLAHCEELEKKIGKSQNDGEKLMEAVVARAMAA